MATISSTGIGSGLDVNGIVTQLMAVERQPLNALRTKASALDSRISAFGALKSQLATLSDAAGKLALAATWNAKAATSSNNAAISVAVADGGLAQAASFSVEVKQLARAQSVASGPLASGPGIGSGTLSIQLGTWSAGAAPSFTAGSAAAVSIDVRSSDTLSGIAAKINAVDAGVTAAVLKDPAGERLLLRSKTTGEAAGFRVQAVDDGTAVSGPGLGVLAFDDPTGGGMAANPIQYAQNAQATVNGIAVSSASNRLADTLPGLSLTLAQPTTAPVEVAVSIDTASMRGAIDGFVAAYNSMNQTLNAATKYDAATRSAALLQGDAATVGLQHALRGMIGAVSGSGGVFERLSDLGISIAKDGAGDLAVDAARLGAALESPKAVQRFFAAAAGGSDGETGFATRLAAFTRAAVGAGGALGEKTASLQARRSSLGKDEDRLNDRLASIEERLRKQYSALDTKMSSLTALNAYVSQQIAQWNRSGR